ncbi:MAG: UDP-N-acetylmuramoyl-L-alanine--D-glutamate ligase [Deltaproteobacteria bacterium]|nr:UDP-N-acetylmuramoyl-L-alanine--D-glutamate ligase [Deltaproteobacteria bacterium]
MHGRYEGQVIGVVGLGKTGLSACRYLRAGGARVRASDTRPSLEADTDAELRRSGVDLFLGGHPPAFFEGLDGVMVSPGVPLMSDPLRQAAARGLRLVGDIEFAWPALEGPVVAITGTNGKSTTTTLVGEMLKASGRRIFMGGNLGTPVFEAAGQKLDAIVLEVSSYQCETVEKFCPKVAVLLNITEDHLDRYPSFDDYAAAKLRLFRAMGESDWAVLSADDSAVVKGASSIRARRLWFSANGRELPGDGIRLHGTLARYCVDGVTEDIDLARSPLKGLHNRENLAAAILAARLMGADWTAIRSVVQGFRGLPHRCVLVRELNGAAYYNDSKATNVGATVRALEGFAGNVILLVGGVEKGGSYEPVRRKLGSIVSRVIAFGSSRDRLAAELGGVVPVETAETLPEAVRLAHGAAVPGDTVLLAPACASFDQFRNYAHRGEVFEAEVGRL